MSQEYALKKKRPGCTGMFYRPNPLTGQGATDSNWPRDGAKLKGEVHEVEGERWLQVSEVKQHNGEWSPIKHGWIPFEYNNHYYLEEC